MSCISQSYIEFVFQFLMLSETEFKGIQYYQTYIFPKGLIINDCGLGLDEKCDPKVKERRDLWPV